MSSLTFLKNYNNYYNRMIKHDFLSTTMSAYTSVTIDNINFNPGDGVFTEQVINWDNDWLPDYVLVDAIKNWYNSSIVESGKTQLFTIDNPSGRVLDTTNWHDLELHNFYDPTTRELNLSRIGNYENENYGTVTFKIEGNWPLNEFSIDINTPNGTTVNIWSDNNDFTFSVTSEIINAEYLKNLGWVDNEDVWGISIWGASPDTFNGTAICKDYNTKWNIGSSWFVMQADRTRKGQYKLTLKKDNIADHYETVVNSPAYVEKATIKNFNDPAIFNKEDLFVNQIKKQEKLLKDKTNMAWLVAWIDNNIEQNTWTSLFNHKSVPYTRNIDEGVDYTTNDIETWISDHQLSGTYKCLKETDDYMWFKVQNEYMETSARILYAWMDYKIYRDRNHESTGGMGGNRSGYTYNFKDGTPFGTMVSQTTTINDQLYNAVKTAEGFITGTDSRFSYINKIVKETKDGVDKYYKIESSYSDWNSTVTYSNTSAVANLFNGLPDGERSTVNVTFNGDIVTFSYRDVTNEMATTANIYADVSSVTPKNSGLIDAPYMAVCIPYTLNESLTGESRQDVISDTNFTARIDSTKAFAAITLLSYCLQDGKYLYDVQLLPYCPMVNEISISGPYHDSFMIEADSISANRKIKFYQTDGNTFDTTTPLMEAYVFFNSSFTFDIPLIISDKNTVFEKKLASETELYRFNSPNYSAFFDFNPYMNNGMTKLNVDCTYKPYKSYIHMNPDFKGLYGSDFNDARGLVITSDFSIPQVTDAWQTYQIQNKNYADIFARNQQHLKVEQKWSEAEAAMNMITAPFAGGVTGGVAGGMKGGMYGAIAGAVVGTAAGLAGGIADYSKTLELNREALNYNQDMYNYNLQNIQALPQTISSISSYDANNKLWPFLEMYDCSDIEKEAMRNKLIYNGMKIGRIDTVNSFISETSNYIKAKLIRNELSDLDYNELNDIALELDKGVFM